MTPENDERRAEDGARGDEQRRAAHRVLRKSTEELARMAEQRRQQKLYRDGKLAKEPAPLDEELVRETARQIDQAHDALFNEEEKE
jgi:hypothetical protein